MGEPLLVLVDDDCGFCRWAAERLHALDLRGRLRFASIQGERGSALLGDVAPEARLRSMHVVRPDGRIESAGAGLVLLADALPAGRPLAWLGRAFPELAERAYAAVASRRDTLGRWVGADACRIPTDA